MVSKANDDDDGSTSLNLPLDINFQEPNEDDLLKELSLLTGGEEQNNKEGGGSIDAEIIKGDFGMIRVGPADISDYNIENIQLTPEDENDPELLAQLANINIASPSNNTLIFPLEPTDIKEPKPSVTLKPLESNNSSSGQYDAIENMDDIASEISQVKKQALEAKRTGNIELTRERLILLKSLEDKLNQRSFGTGLGLATSIDLKPSEDKLNQKSLGTGLELATNPDQMTLISPPPSTPFSGLESLPSPSQKQEKPMDKKYSTAYKKIISDLQNQVQSCQAAQTFYSSVGRKSEANLFSRRQEAFERDYQQLRAMIKALKPPPETITCPVTFETRKLDPSITENEIHLYIGEISPSSGGGGGGSLRKKIDKSTSYRLQSFLELPGVAEDDWTKIMNTKYSLEQLESGLIKEPFIFKFPRKDIRLSKAIEYKKIRVDFVKSEGFLFFKSQTTKFHLHFKIDKLLSECNFSEKVALLDENQKNSGLSALVKVAVRSPIGGKDAPTLNDEKWTLLPSFGNTTFDLYPSLHQLTKPSISAALSPPGSFVGNVRSFEVIEYELELLANDPNSLIDPANMDLQIALEGLRDQIQTMVEIGQLSIEDYIADLKVAIEKTKKLAIAAKNSGDRELALKYVKHVEIMKKEVAAGEVSLDADLVDQEIQE